MCERIRPMRRLLISLLALLAGGAAAAQTPAASPRYTFPVRDVAGHYSANFGEIRPGHFHAGVDIKTDGAEGKPLVAVADGFISRVVITPSGYGRAVYLTLNDGSTAVYGHLSRFRDDLEACVRDARHARSSNNADLHFPAGRFPVRQGELLGYSGDSGSSLGPHLHFELREAGTERRLNTVRSGMFRPEDNLAPRILRLHYFQVDTVQGVCLRSRPASYAVTPEAGDRYRLQRREPLPVGAKGYFVIEVSDRRNNVGNTFGIWRLQAAVDGIPYFEYRMDGFPYASSRHSDAISWYAQKLHSRNEVIRLAQLDKAPDFCYPILEERGLVRVAPGQQRTIRIEAEDDCGNCSTLTFEICGEAAPFRGQADTAALVVRPDRNNPVVLGQWMSATIPAGALYEAAFCHPEQLPPPEPSVPGVAVLSPAVKLLDASVPLFTEATVTIRTEVPRPLQIPASLASYNPDNGQLSYVGGTCTGSAVTARTRTTGWLVAVADTLPPTIRPLFAEEADCSRAESLRFRVTDNFSGIASISLHIDGRWVPCDRLPMRSIVFHRFEQPAEGRMHRYRLHVTDASGNSSLMQGSFYR